MLLLRCPKCGNSQKYQPMTPTLKNKKKACVYCGNNFSIKDRIIKVIEK